MRVGTVKWFDSKKGFGFVTSDDTDFFVHFSQIESNREFKSLYDGDQVEFEPGESDKGPIAKSVKVIDSIMV